MIFHHRVHRVFSFLPSREGVGGVLEYITVEVFNTIFVDVYHTPLPLSRGESIMKDNTRTAQVLPLRGS